MRKWMIAGAAVVAIGAMIAVALWNLNSLIDRNRDYLLAQAEQALGRKVSVGEMEVALWGGIGVRLENFSLSDDPSFNPGEFVRAADLQINLKLWPLLRKQVEIKRLILHDPVIAVIRNEEGAFNFSGIGKSKKEKSETEKGPAEEKPPAEDGPPPFLAIALIDVSNGAVHYLDRKEKIDLRIEAIDFRVRDLGLDKAFPVELAAALFTDKQNVKLQGALGPVPGGDWSRAPFEGRLSIDPLDYGRLVAAMPKAKQALPAELVLSGLFRIQDLEAKGTIADLVWKVAVDAKDAAIKFGSVFQKDSGGPLAFSAEGQYNEGRALFRRSKLILHNLELSGKGEAQWGEATIVNFSIDSNRPSLAGWDRIIPPLSAYRLAGDMELHGSVHGRIGNGATPRLQGRLVLSGISAQPPQLPKPIRDLNGVVRLDGQQAEVEETSLSVGDSRLRLAGRIVRFAPLSLSYRLSSPELHPADFQGPVSEERKADVLKDLKSEGTVSSKDGNLVFQGRIASDQGTFQRIGYRDLAATLSWANKTAGIKNFRVNALKGTLQGEGEYAINGTSPRFSFASQLRGLDLRELYGAFDPKGRRDIQGRLAADIRISGSGKEWSQIKPALQGQGRAEVAQGALLDFNLAEGVLSGITGIPGLTSLINPQVRGKYPETFEAKDTVFDELSAVFDLGGGRMQVKSLRIAAADYLAQGSGWVDFDRRVNFRSSLVFSQRLSADLAQAAREVRYIFNEQNQFQIPFVLSGTLPNVRPKPDTEYLARLFQRGFLQKGADELRRRFLGPRESEPGEKAPASEGSGRKSTEEMIRKGLEGIFGR